MEHPETTLLNKFPYENEGSVVFRYVYNLAQACIKEEGCEENILYDPEIGTIFEECRNSIHLHLELSKKLDGDELHALLLNTTQNFRRSFSLIVRSKREKLRADNLETLFSICPFPSALAEERDGRIIVIHQNFAFQEQFRHIDEFSKNLLLGKIMGCVNADLPEGCGHTEFCGNCEIHNKLLRTFQHRQSYSREKILLSEKNEQGAEKKHYLFSAFPFDTNGKVQVIISLEDITSQEKLESEFQELKTLLAAIEKN